VNLSFCLALWYCIKTAKRIAEILSPPGYILVFSNLIFLPNWDWAIPDGDLKYRRSI